MELKDSSAGEADPQSHASAEQQVYAGVLDVGMKAGLALLVVTFLAYVGGLLPAHIPLEELPRLWGLPVGEYLDRTGSPIGWQWLALLSLGDYLNFVGLTILSGTTIVCYLAIIPHYLRGRDTAFLVIAVIEVLVLVLAASGLLIVGH